MNATDVHSSGFKQDCPNCLVLTRLLITKIIIPIKFIRSFTWEIMPKWNN